MVLIIGGRGHPAASAAEGLVGNRFAEQPPVV